MIGGDLDKSPLREGQASDSSGQRSSFDGVIMQSSGISDDEGSSTAQRAISKDHWVANAGEEDLVEIENAAKSMEEVDVPLASNRAPCCCCDLYTLWKFTGPGWLMSIAYLDPGNLEADLQSGAYTGYQLLWMLLWATMGGLLLQVLAARLGVVTGKNLAQMCRLDYPRPVSLVLWFMTELAIIGSDIQEVIGSAIAIKLLFGLDLWIGCLITGFDTFTFLIIHAFGVRKLEAFFAALIFTMMVCFFINFGWTKPVWGGGPWEVNGGGILLGTLVPTVNDYAVVQAVGILGAVIMPHNIYLHSALVQSRKIDRQNHHAVEEANKYNAIESTVALIVSFFINAAVVTVFARGFFNDVECAEPGWNGEYYSGSAGILGVKSSGNNLGCYTGLDARTNEFDSCFRRTSAPVSINSTVPTNSSSDPWMTCTNSLGKPGVCCSIGLQNAGQALEGILGGAGKIVWAIGLLAAGQASTMTGTFAGQYVMEGFLNWKVSPVLRVTITRTIALGPAIAVGIYMGTNTAAGDVLNEWLNILQSVQLPFALLPVLHFTSSPRIMGERFMNKGWVNITVWTLAALVIGINVYLIQNFLADPNSGTPDELWFYLLVAGLGILYFAFIVIVIWDDIKIGWSKVQVFLNLAGEGSGSSGFENQRQRSRSGSRKSYSVLNNP